MRVVIIGQDSAGKSEISKILAGKMEIGYYSSGEIKDEDFVWDVSEEDSQEIKRIKKQAGRDSVIVGLLASREDESLKKMNLKEECDFVTYVENKTPEDVAGEILRDIKVVLNFKQG
ncbi:MAG: hypothetical protein ACP5NZ_02020 [Nanobdellota archaeon]